MSFDCTSALAEVYAEYKSLPVKTRKGKEVQLRNILLLGDEGLSAANDLLQEITADGASTFDVLPRMRELVALLADDSAAMSAEMKDWPAAMYERLIGDWQVATQLGEAPPSES